MLTSLAVIKEHVWSYLQICGFQSKFPVEIQVPVQVSSSEFKLKICTEIASKQLENCKFSNQTHREPHLCKETQTEINSAETRRTKFSRNDLYLKHRIANAKYDNIIFYVHNHNQEILKSSKIAKILPIFKSKDKLDITNYHQKYILPVISKVYENVLLSTTLQLFLS